MCRKRRLIDFHYIHIGKRGFKKEEKRFEKRLKNLFYKKERPASYGAGSVSLFLQIFNL
jgi:hypothetical protein